jgi:electron transfer flavoprotein beta subunit
MKIVVCIKQVPDTWAEKKLDPSDNTLDRASVDAVTNELDEYAVEEALQIVEREGGEVVLLSMGPDRVSESLRKVLGMGAHAAVAVTDDALHGADAPATARVLAAAIKQLAPDLVIFGSESTDARMSVVPAMVAEVLGFPQLTFAAKVEVEGGTVRIDRATEAGVDIVEASLPAVVSVIEKINEPRYPSFKGIMAAKKKKITTLELSDLGLDTGSVGLAAAWSTVDDFAVRPPRSKGQIITDDGTAAAALADYLVAQKLV